MKDIYVPQWVPHSSWFCNENDSKRNPVADLSSDSPETPCATTKTTFAGIQNNMDIIFDAVLLPPQQVSNSPRHTSKNVQRANLMATTSRNQYLTQTLDTKMFVVVRSHVRSIVFTFIVCMKPGGS